MMFDTHSTLVGQAGLDALWLKTQVIANNMANVDTPGFKASNVSFETALNGALNSRGGGDGGDGGDRGGANGAAGTARAARSNNAQSAGVNRARVTTLEDISVRVDENDVVLEREQTELWKTYAQYSYLMDSVAGHYRNIGTAISNMRG